MDFSNPHFAEPRWLWLAVLAPLLLVVLHRFAAAARRRQLAQLASPRFIGGLTATHSPMRRLVKEIMLVIAVACVGVALARPRWGEQAMAARVLGEDVVFALDCSRSMLAADIAPNRLQRARLAVADFVQRHARGRVGLVAFAGEAFLQCPLTFDYNAFEESLMAIDETTIPTGGTDLGRALDEAFHAMKKNEGRKLVVLLTDGEVVLPSEREDQAERSIRVAESLAKTNLVVFTIGVGTSAGAEIRVQNEQGQYEFVRDTSGEIVRSRLDEATLRAIAEATGGEYHSLGPSGEGLARVRAAAERLDLATGTGPERRRGVERFHIPVAALLLLLVAESLMGTRRKKGANVVG